MKLLLVFLGTLHSIVQITGLPGYTGYGMKSCKLWPEFSLKNLNSLSSQADYGASYSLQELSDSAEADVTIIGLYYADNVYSQENAPFQEQLGDKLRDLNSISISNVLINNYAPYSCAQKECPAWWYWPSTGVDYNNYYNILSWITETCNDYVGGCYKDSPELQFENWQSLLVETTTLPVLQDEFLEDAWDRFGGGEGDLFVYDRHGRLYTTLCTSYTYDLFPRKCGFNLKDGLRDSVNFDEVVAFLAAKLSDLEALTVDNNDADDDPRCVGFDDAYYSYFSYYYYDDGGFNGTNSSDINGTFSTSGEDDAVAAAEDVDDDNVVRDRREKFHKIASKIPAGVYVMVGVISVVTVAVSALCFRWRLQRIETFRRARMPGGAQFLRLSRYDRYHDKESDLVAAQDPSSSDRTALLSDSYGAL